MAAKECWLGLDLADKQDYTAICCLEAEDSGEDRVYSLTHLDRWQGVGYHEGIEKVRKVVARLDDDVRKRSHLVLDATGPGGPLVEDYQRAALNISLTPITITNGLSATRDEKKSYWWHVPKRDLVARVNVVIEAKPTRLRIAASLPHAKTLVDELRAFSVKIDPLTANDSYSAWREKDHDDMVLSVALAVWLAEKFKAPAKYVDLTNAWSSGRPRLF